MNKAVKLILALSIAILFPIVIGLIVFLAYSNEAKSLANSYPDVKFPDVSVCNKNQSTVINGRTVTTTTVDQACRNRLENDYNNQIEKQRDIYNQNLKKLDKITEKRIIISLIAALLGFIMAFVSFRYTPIATGLSAGSMFILLASSTFYSDIIAVSGATIVLLYLACFVVLIVMFFFADKYFRDAILAGNPSSAPSNASAKPSQNTTNSK